MYGDLLVGANGLSDHSAAGLDYQSLLVANRVGRKVDKYDEESPPGTPAMQSTEIRVKSNRKFDLDQTTDFEIISPQHTGQTEFESAHSGQSNAGTPRRGSQNPMTFSKSPSGRMQQMALDATGSSNNLNSGGGGSKSNLRPAFFNQQPAETQSSFRQGSFNKGSFRQQHQQQQQ
jgi:hypothetical protein